MWSLVASLGLTVAPAAATEPMVLPSPLSLWGDDAVYMGEKGRVWILARNAKDPVIAWTRDGTIETKRIPSPMGGYKNGESNSHAILGADAADRPVVAMTGQHCVKQGDQRVCKPRMYVSENRGGSWSTRRLQLQGGALGDIAITAAGTDSWVIAASWTEQKKGEKHNPWQGIFRYRGGTAAERWSKGCTGQDLVFPDAGNPNVLMALSGKSIIQCTRKGRSQVAWGFKDEIDAVGSGSDRVWIGWAAGVDYLKTNGETGESVPLGQAESGWHADLDRLPDGRTLAVWYFSRNPYNKGLKLAVQEGGVWRTTTLVRDENDNRGWKVSLDTNRAGRVAIAYQNRSDKTVEVLRFGSADAALAEDVPDAGNWTDKKRRMSLFGYLGVWYHWTDTFTHAPSRDDYTYGELKELGGEYTLSPGAATEVGFAGQLGRTDLVMQYARRSDDQDVQQIQRMQRISGKLGIQSFPVPGTETQLHFRTADIEGVFTSKSGEKQTFSTNERMVEMRMVNKEAVHVGLRVHNWQGPQDVYLSKNMQLIGAYEADARFSGYGITVGWSLMNYLKKYEHRYFGPNADVNAGIGLTRVALDLAGAGTRDDIGAFMPGEVDLGLTGYRRFKKFGGMGYFVQAGARGSVIFTGAGEPEDTDDDPNEDDNYLVFSRTDLRYGPYFRVGGVF